MNRQHDTDHTLERIDAVLADGYEVVHDWEVGPDAVRSRPAEHGYAEGGLNAPVITHVPVASEEYSPLPGTIAHDAALLSQRWQALLSEVHPLLLRAVGWTTRLRFRRRRRRNVVHICIIADHAAFTAAAMRAMTGSMLQAQRAFARFDRAAIREEHPEAYMTPGRAAAHFALRATAVRERRDLAAWWDDHLDHVYADLGLERPR